MSSNEAEQLEESCKALGENSQTRPFTEFNLIYKYWTEKAPFTDCNNSSHKLALEKFVRKAKKRAMKNNSSFNDTSVCNYSSSESNKKKTKKGKKNKQTFKDAETHIPLKTEDDERISPIKTPQEIKVKQEGKKVNENRYFFDFENKTSPKKKKQARVQSNDDSSKMDESIESVGSIVKKKQKSNSSAIKAESLDDGADSDYLEDTTLNSSANFSFDKFNASPNDFIACETPEGQSIAKKRKKKKLQMKSGSHLNQNVNEVAEDEEQNTSKQDNNSGSAKKNKKKKKSLQTNASKISVGNELEISNAEAVTEKSKKDKKKRKWMETEVNEENEFNGNSQQFSIDERPKKKRKNKLSANDINVEAEQNALKSEKKFKKKSKMLKGIVPGLDSQPELTKFTSKVEEESLNEGESESEDLWDDDNKSSFPRTPNNQTFNQKFDSEEKNSRTLFVGNLPTNVSKKTLIAAFKAFGNVENVRIRGAVPGESSVSQKIANFKKDYHKNVKSLSGFVVFSDKDDAEKALVLNGQVFNGHHLRVDKATWKKSSPDKKTQYNKKTSVFLGNLPYDIDDDSLRSVFTKCGAIENIRVIRDKNTGRAKGFGFVQFQDESSITSALNLSGTEVNGREIRVKPCEDNPKKAELVGNAQNARNRVFNPENRGKGPNRQGKFFKGKFKGEDQDSGPKKSFKKMQKKRNLEREKKKISSLFIKKDK